MKRVIAMVFLSVFLFICFAPNALAYTIFQEDFNHGNADGWEVFKGIGTYSYEVVDNVLRMSVTEEGPGGYVLVIHYADGLILPESFEVTFEGRLIDSLGGGKGSNHLNARLHTTDMWSPYYTTGWRQNEYNDFPLWGPEGERGLVGPNAYNFNEYQWHTIRVIKEESSISAYINDDEMYTTSISGLTGGSFGIGVSHGIYEVDNIVIQSDIAPVPEPATMLLLGSGLVGLAGFRRRFKK